MRVEPLTTGTEHIGSSPKHLMGAFGRTELTGQGTGGISEHILRKHSLCTLFLFLCAFTGYNGAVDYL